MNPHELKALQVRRRDLESEVRSLEAERSRIGRQIHERKNEINAIKQSISKQADSAPVVSEHAMLRYIERVCGIDLGKIQAEILTESNRKSIDFAGNCRIKSGPIEFIVKDRVVVSVVGEIEA